MAIVMLTRCLVCSVDATNEYVILSRKVNGMDQYVVYMHACRVEVLRKISYSRFNLPCFCSSINKFCC